jgi:malate permease and related proteins
MLKSTRQRDWQHRLYNIYFIVLLNKSGAVQSEIILNQILILGVIAFIGVIATKAKVITETLKEGIASLVFNITLPLLILSSFISLDISFELLRNGLLVIIASFISLVFLFFSGYLSSRFQKLERDKAGIHILHTAFGNIVFLGFPLMNALFPGGEALFYATLFYLSSTTVLWTVGVNFLNYSSAPGTIQKLRNLLNPNTVAFAIGIIFMLSGIRLPEFMEIPLGGLGDTTSYLSMLYIGSMLAQTNIRRVLRGRQAYILSVNKMIISPVLLIVMFRLILDLLSINMDPVAFTVVILQAGTPCMTVIVVLARKFNADDRHAMENVVISTIMSLITLPLLYWMIGSLAFT